MAQDDDTRRVFLKVGIGVIGAGVACVAGVPGAAMVLYPLGNETTSGSSEPLPAGKPEDFPEGEPVKVDLHADKVDAWNRVEDVKVGSAWVIRRGAELIAFSTVCPHLGCAVEFDRDASKFKCPCHKSVFTVDGKVEGGPSPRGMDRLDVEAGDRLVAIRYQRFKQGMSDKEPA